MTQLEQLFKTVAQLKALNLTKKEQIQVNVYLAQNSVVKELDKALGIARQVKITAGIFTNYK